MGEPTVGLFTQPVLSLLKSWGRSAAEIATFAAVLSLPWSIKLLYGILTDFVPIPGGLLPEGYLLLTSFGIPFPPLTFSRSLRAQDRSRSCWLCYCSPWSAEPCRGNRQSYGNSSQAPSASPTAAGGLCRFCCQRTSFRVLVHLSVVTGILATLAYAFMSGPVSAVLVTIAVVFTHLMANLVQSDLAARVCRPETAGTTVRPAHVAM